MKRRHVIYRGTSLPLQVQPRGSFLVAARLNKSFRLCKIRDTDIGRGNLIGGVGHGWLVVAVTYGKSPM